jgi:hypothetical protein
LSEKQQAAKVTGTPKASDSPPSSKPLVEESVPNAPVKKAPRGFFVSSSSSDGGVDHPDAIMVVAYAYTNRENDSYPFFASVALTEADLRKEPLDQQRILAGFLVPNFQRLTGFREMAISSSSRGVLVPSKDIMRRIFLRHCLTFLWYEDPQGTLEKPGIEGKFSVLAEIVGDPEEGGMDMKSEERILRLHPMLVDSIIAAFNAKTSIFF